MLPIAILAGGLSTRLRPLTDRIPKSLVEVDGRPFAAHQIALLRRRGITDIVFLVGHLGEMIQRTLGDGTRQGVQIRYVFDGPHQLGTGGAIRTALPALGDAFLVLYGDSYLDCDYAAIARTFIASGKPGLMTVHRNRNRWDRSNVRFAGRRIVAYDKAAPTPAMRHVDYGLGVFSPAAFTDRPADEAFDLAAIYQDLLAAGNLASFLVPHRFYEIGSPAGLAETRTYLTAKGAARP